MPAAPRGSCEDGLHFLLRGQYAAPQETPPRTYTQRYASPRAALQALRLLAVGWGNVFVGTSAVGRGSARSTVHSAYAHLANVCCRSPPAHCGPPRAPGRPRPGPLHSTVPWSTGSLPPAPVHRQRAGASAALPSAHCPPFVRSTSHRKPRREAQVRRRAARGLWGLIRRATSVNQSVHARTVSSASAVGAGHHACRHAMMPTSTYRVEP
jgi:hypothetical protein